MTDIGGSNPGRVLTGLGGAGRLPTGTVTFLRTDVEGSMRLVRKLGSAWDDVNASHLEIIRSAVESHGGVVVRTEGDALFAAFPEARAATEAAAAAQRALHEQHWPVDGGLAVRMGLHSGEAHLAGDDYGGFDVNRAARVAAAGHGGQILLSATTTVLVEDQLPAGVFLVDLGSHQLRDVPRPERLAQLTVDGLADQFPPLRTAGPVIGNLPDRMTSFVGREAELRQITDLLGRARLVTLTGPGGIGKSSLAVEVARQSAEGFLDGAWFIPLADITDPADIGATIAHGIGIFDGPERTASSALLPYLVDRSMLIVLDNVEHLVDGADQIAAVVRASPDSKIIVTSRAPLHVAGEHEVPVPSLQDEAVALFTTRADAVRPGWEPGADLEIVREICDLLDDLPLGIELAAARIGLLPPTVIRDRLAARLPLPGSGPRDTPARQRTLEAVVAWGHDQLEPSLQRLLHTLSVFEGGFDVEQVEALSALEGGHTDRLDDLMRLADRSIIASAPNAGARPRFTMLQTIQAFAITQLDANDRLEVVRRAHAEAFLVLVTRNQTLLGTSQHAAALDRIGPEIANLRAALRWAIGTNERDLALRLVGQLWRFWLSFGLTAEGRTVTETALALPDAPTSGSVQAWAAGAAGSLAYWQADSTNARSWYEQQMTFARAAEDERCITDAMFNLGHIFFIDSDDEEIQLAYADDVARRFREIGDAKGEARAVWALGLIALGAGRLDDAIDHLLQRKADFERLDDRQYHAMTVQSLGWAEFTRGDIRTATRWAVAGFVESHAMRDIGTTSISLHVGVLIAVLAERYGDAAVLCGAFDAASQRYGVRPPAALGRFIDQMDPFAATRAAMLPDAYALAYERGRRMTLDESVALIIELGADVIGTTDDLGQPDFRSRPQ